MLLKKAMGKEYKIDIHGKTENDAYCTLLGFFVDLPQNAKKVVVVHGYRGGTVLKTMVANFAHHRIDYALSPMNNPGETHIYLK